MNTNIIITIAALMVLLQSATAQTIQTNLVIERDSMKTDNVEAIDYTITINNKKGIITFDATDEKELDEKILIDKKIPTEIHNTETSVVHVMKTKDSRYVSLLFNHQCTLLTIGIQTGSNTMTYYTQNAKLAEEIRRNSKKM